MKLHHLYGEVQALAENTFGLGKMLNALQWWVQVHQEVYTGEKVPFTSGLVLIRSKTIW